MTEIRGPPPCQAAGCQRDAHVRSSYAHCLEHTADPDIAPEHPGTEPAGIGTDEFTFFFGASCGSSRKTLRQLEEPNVCLSYATANKTTWDSIDSLLVDSGGYSLLVQGEGEYTDSIDDYLDYVVESGAEWFVCRDIPFVTNVLEEFDRDFGTVMARHVELTKETIAGAMSRCVDANPMVVLQGYTAGDYRRCYDELAQLGLITDRVAVGSLKHRESVEVANIISELDQYIPDKVQLHGLGVEVPELKHDIVRERLSSADSSRYIATARWRGNRDEHPPRLRDDEPATGWHETIRAYLDMRAELRNVLSTEDEPDGAQETLTLSLS